MYVSINATGLASCVNGKSNMWRKKDLEQCGGLRCFGGFLAEDNVIGEKIMNLGLSHTLLSDAVWQPMGATALMDFFSRRARWTRIRKYNVTAATLLEPFTESLVCGLYGCWACMQLFGLEWEMVPLWWVGHMLMWLVCDMAVFTVFMQSRGGWTNETEQTDVVVVEQHEQKEGVTGMWVLVWLVREITALPLWMYAIAGNHVHWRGRAFRLRSNGTAVEM
jgi:ceramide glucosyltransferase